MCFAERNKLRMNCGGFGFETGSMIMLSLMKRDGRRGRIRGQKETALFDK